MSMAVYVIVAIVIILVVAVVTALAAGNVSVQKYKREEEAKVGYFKLGLDYESIYAYV